MSSNIDLMRRFVESFVPEMMRENRVPGLSVAVVADDQVVYSEGFGSRDLRRSLPATPDTLYGIGSCTKSFVGLAIMQLAEKGKLRLDDPASDHIPIEIGLPGKDMTIHDLLTHSSGLPSLATSTIAISRGLGRDTGVPWGGVNDFYRHVNGAQDEIADEPGRRFFYNNAGYRMLGHIVQNASGVPFHEYIEENILRPLGMERSTLVKSRWVEDPDRLTPYRKGPDGPEPADFPYPDPAEIPEFSFIAAAGGIVSSVMDLTHYLEACMNGGVYGGVRLASPESIERAQTLHIDRPPRLYGRYGYGYGWGVTEDFLGHKMVSHGGSISVSTAFLAFIPDLKIGVAMAANSMGPPYAEMSEGVIAALMGMDPREDIPAIRIRERMRSLTGSYETYRGVERVEVVGRAGLLYVKASGLTGEVLTPLIPVDDRMGSLMFYTMTNGVRQLIEFVVESPSKVDLYIERYRYHKTP